METVLGAVRQFFIDRLDSLFPEPAASFAAGILLGARRSIPYAVLEDFRRAGLTHILAISGYNIIILIVFVTAIFSFLPRKISTWISLAVILLFTLLVGASASVVRAAIMGSLSLFARLVGRKSSGMRALFITAGIMILFDPRILFDDIGFQLSFAATAGILLFAERIKFFLKKIPEAFAIRTSLATTLAAQVFTTPLIFWHFGGISFIAPLANIVILPLVPLLMLGSFLSLIFGKILAAPTWILFTIVLKLIHFFASLPFAFIDFGTS